jgi:hypothetical protein
MPASDEQMQDAILQLENVTRTALAEAASIDQAATDGEERARARDGTRRGGCSQQELQARTDQKVQRQVDKLNELKTGRFITFPDNLPPLELVSCDKIACKKCNHPFKVGGEGEDLQSIVCNSCGNTFELSISAGMSGTLKSIKGHIDRNSGRSMCNQSHHMLATLHSKRSISEVYAAKAYDAECSECHEQRSWSTKKSFVKHQQKCTGIKPTQAPAGYNGAKKCRSNFIGDCSVCGYQRTWKSERDLRTHQGRCTGKAPYRKTGWTKV